MFGFPARQGVRRSVGALLGASVSFAYPDVPFLYTQLSRLHTLVTTLTEGSKKAEILNR